MKAVAVIQTGGPEKLQVLDLPIPEPNHDEVLIRIAAAGVNEVDTMFREGYLNTGTRPLIMGSDFSGVVERVGENVNRHRVGDQVYGYKLLGNGTYCEFTTVKAGWVASKPTTLTHVASAAWPCVGLTAYQAVIDTLDVARGETVLVTGAAGGVGTVAVQLAVDRGARVVATASHSNHEYLRELGAEEVIDYRDEDWPEQVRQVIPEGVDAALTTRGGRTKLDAPRVVRDGGRLVWISGEDKPGPPMERRISGSYVGGIPLQGTLDALRELIEADRLRLPVAEVYSLDDSRNAQIRVTAGHVRGKLVIDVDSSLERGTDPVHQVAVS